MEWNLTTISSWSTALQRASSPFLDLNNLIHLRLFVQVFHLFPTCLSPDFTEMLQVASNKDNDAQALCEGKVWINDTKIYKGLFKHHKKHVKYHQTETQISQRFTKHLREHQKKETPKSGRIICGEASVTDKSQRKRFCCAMLGTLGMQSLTANAASSTAGQLGTALDLHRPSVCCLGHLASRWLVDVGWWYAKATQKGGPWVPLWFFAYELWLSASHCLYTVFLQCKMKIIMWQGYSSTLLIQEQHK